MCGLAGFFSTAGLRHDEADDCVSRMIAPIVHRGPDDRGTWTDARAGIALGFRRLAILDLSPLGHQPMQSASGRFVIVFNGEVYNFVELRHELERRGHTFRGGSDTEVMLAAFEQWGIHHAVSRFVGMFAIAVWDASRRELSLIRDRLGKKPLYVYSEPGLVSFGSELKTLMAGPSFDRAIDSTALAAYFRYLYVPAPRTIFRHAVKIPAAHILTIGDPGQPLPKAQCYWSLENAALRGMSDPVSGDDEAIVDQLDALLKEAVRCRLQSDVPLGALLSGGIDSSTLVALMQEASTRPVKTYTIGFAEQDFNEARHAADVARHLGTEHTELKLTADDAQALVAKLPRIFDEPFADPSELPTLLVSQLARREVTVALCGDGGDEVFGGYNRYVYGRRVMSRLEPIPRAVRQTVAAGIRSVSPPAWNRVHQFASAVLPGVPGEHFGERVHKIGHLLDASSTGDMYRSLLSAWQRPEELLPEELLMDQALDRRSLDNDVNQRILDGNRPSELVDRMMLADQLMYLPDDLLAKVDRASMAVSLEVRAPILDHRVVEFSWRLPHTLKVRDGVGKWILRQVLYRRVPKSMVERPKMGFSVPIDQWLRGPLRSWAEGLLSSTANGGTHLLNQTAVCRAWQALQDGRQPAGAALWAVLMFQAWRHEWQN